MADIKERIVIESVDNTTRGMRSAQNNLNAFDRTLKRVQTTLLGFVGINIATHMIQSFTQISDSAVELEAKLRLMTDSTEDFNYAQEELVKLSLESGSSLEANTILFTRMNKSIKSMGGNTQTTLDTTRALSQGLRISGASTQESASVIRQWSQAMASGVLRGEEFNAVSENGSRIILALSESLGVTIGELRAMSKEGKLTAQVVTEALLQQSQTLAEENAKLPLTIGRAVENVKTKWLLLLQTMKGGNEGVANVINSIAENFDELATAVGYATKALIAFLQLKVVTSLKAWVIGVQAVLVKESELAIARREAFIMNGKFDRAKRKADAEEITRIQTKAMKEHEANNKRRIAEREKLKASIIKAEHDLQSKKIATEKAIAIQKALNAEIVKTHELNILKAEGNVREQKQATWKQKRTTNELADKERLLKAEIARLNQMRLISGAEFLSVENSKKLSVAQSQLILTKGKLRVETQKLSIQQSILNEKVIEHTLIVERDVAVQTGSNAKIQKANTALTLSQTRLNELIIQQTFLLDVNTKSKFANSAGTEVLIANTNRLTHAQTVNNTASSGFGAITGRFGKALDSVNKFLNKAGLSLAKFGGVIKGVKTFIGGLVGVIGKVGSALLGWPGIIAYVGYELTQFFGINLPVLFEAVGVEFDKLGARITNVFDQEQLDKELEAIDDHWSNRLDIILETEKAIKEGFKDLESYKADLAKKEKERQLKQLVDLDKLKQDKIKLEGEFYANKEVQYKLHLDRMNKLEGTDEASLEAKKEQIKLDEEIRIADLAKVYQNETDKNEKIKQIKQESAEAIAQLEANHLKEQQERYEKFYLEEIELASNNKQKQLSIRRDMLTKFKELNDSRIKNARDMASKLADAEKTAVNAVRDAEDELKRIKQDGADFLKEINGDTRADWQKNLDAQKDRDSAIKSLREADALDAQGKHTEAQELRKNTLKDLKDLIKTEKTRSSEAKQGSLAEIQARLNATNATNLFKDALKETSEAQVNIIKENKESAKTAGEALDNTIAQITKLEKASAKAQTEIKTINTLLAGFDDVEIEMNTTKIEAQIDQIDTDIKNLSQEIEVTVKTIRSHETGIIEQGADVAKKSGGFIPRKDRVPGTGSGDKVKALLEPGEFIMRKSAVDKYGSDKMYAMNNGEDDPNRYADGGMVQHFAKGGSVEAFKQSNNIWINHLSDWIKRSTQSGRGFAHLMSTNKAQMVTSVIKNIIESRKDLHGKDPKDVAKINSLNDLIFGSAKSSATATRTGWEGYKQSLKEGSYRARITEERNALLGFMGLSGKQLYAGGSLRDKDDEAKEQKDREESYVKRKKDSKIVQSVRGFFDDRRSGKKSNKKDIENIIREEDPEGLGLVKFSLGGMIKRFAEGGKVAGSGIGDTVRALLTPGEFVMKKGAVTQFGSDFMQSINQGIMPKKFASGGLVGANGADVDTINVNFNMNGQQATGSFAKNDATMQFIEQLKQSEATT